MGYFKNLIKAFAGTGAAAQYFIQTGQWIWPDDNKDTYIARGYKEIPNLYAIISLIIQKSSVVPFEVYQVKDKAKYMKYKAKMKNLSTVKDVASSVLLKSQALEKVENSEIERLLLNPNEQQTMEQLFEQIDGYRLLTGNSYLWAWTPGVGNNATKPVQLHVPPATMVSIVTGDLQKPIKEYKLNYLADAIPVEDMGHFKNWNPMTSGNSLLDGLYGMSPLVGSRRLMQKYKDADIAQGSMFRNMGPAGILSSEKDSGNTEEQAIAIKDQFKKLHGGVINAGDIVVTSAAVRWQQIGLSPVDLNILEGKEEMLGELCNIYHVPIGLFTRVNSTENNMVESRKMMITDAVIPCVENRKGVLNKWLAPKFGDNLVIEFDYSVFSEISEELDKLVTAAEKMYWISPNEKRSMTNYDMDPNPNMDKFYFPSGLTELDEMNTVPEDVNIPGLTDFNLEEEQV